MISDRYSNRKVAQRGHMAPTTLALTLGIASVALGLAAWAAAPAVDCTTAKGAWDSKACPAWASLPPPEFPAPRETLTLKEPAPAMSKRECSRDSNCPADRPLCRSGRCKVVELIDCPTGLGADGEEVPVCAAPLNDTARPAPRPEPRKDAPQKPATKAAGTHPCCDAKG